VGIGRKLVWVPENDTPAVSGSVPGGDDLPAAVRGRDVAYAAARGVVAAMSMTGVRAVTGGLGFVQQSPPQAMIRQITPRLIKKVPHRRQDAVIELVHWAYGGVGGAGYGLLPAGVRGRPWAGPVYGLMIWAGFEFGIAPVMNLRRAERSWGHSGERLALAADHALYGLVLSEIRPAHKATR